MKVIREIQFYRRVAPNACFEIDSMLNDFACAVLSAAPERQQSMLSPGSDRHTLDEDAGRGD